MERIGAVSDGMAEDILRSITQLICAEGHYKTLIEKYDSELNNGLIGEEDATDYVERINEAVDELQSVSEERRALMLSLQDQYGGDTHYWCLVKHLAAASYNAFEAYQASDNDAAMLTRYLKIHKRFIKAAAAWLGFEPMECAACFSDALKGNEGTDDGENETDNSM